MTIHLLLDYVIIILYYNILCYKGLLVGKRSSKPLDMLCTNHDGLHRVYDFLSKYDYLTNLALEQQDNKLKEETSENIIISDNTKTPRNMKLQAKSRIISRSSIYRKRKPRYSFTINMQSNDNNYDIINSIVENAKNKIIEMENIDISSKLDLNDKDTKEKRNVIQRALKIMQDGLIERNEEVKLLLLAALSKEHLLLLGPPGTGYILIFYTI